MAQLVPILSVVFGVVVGAESVGAVRVFSNGLAFDMTAHGLIVEHFGAGVEVFVFQGRKVGNEVLVVHDAIDFRNVRLQPPRKHGVPNAQTPKGI